MGAESIDYCRQIEAYLCQKNDGHLIRVVGPSFELVSRWAADGVPLKIALSGIDRYFERYYRKGPRRRPVRIDFCEADVRDVFDEWRRAVGMTAAVGSEASAGDGSDTVAGAEPPHARRGVSLPAHLERALLQLTNARASGTLSVEADGLLDRVSQELDAARASTAGLRGAARRSLVERLDQLDGELLKTAREALNAHERLALDKEAQGELSAFRDAMSDEAYRRARDAAIDRLVREWFRLPTLTFP